MYKHIFDTHTHYDDFRYSLNLDGILRQQQKNGVEYIINSSSSLPTAKNAVAIAAKYDFIYSTVGIYPLESKGLPATWLKQIEELAKEPKVVAIGEIGLDYHDIISDRAMQRKVFCDQLVLAQKLKLPIQIHDREADEDTLAILREYRPEKIMLHRYSALPRFAEAFLDLGAYFSFCCSITYPEWSYLKGIVRDMPIEKLVLETDSPFLAPYHMSGATSNSEMISFVAEEIATVRKKYSAQDIIDIANLNSKKFFDIV